MGSNSDTLKIEYNGVSYLKFRATEMIESFNKYPKNETLRIRIVGRPNINNWMGRQSAQVFIDDYDLEVGTVSDF